MAKEAHEGQFDRGGEPYIGHPTTVASFVTDPTEKIVALLHDVVEDSHFTIVDIRREFGDEIAEAITVLTHGSDEYAVYIAKIKANPLARAVKIADLRHNMDLSRIEHPTEVDFSRLAKYEQALRTLLW